MHVCMHSGNLNLNNALAYIRNYIIILSIICYYVLTNFIYIQYINNMLCKDTELRRHRAVSLGLPHQSTTRYISKIISLTLIITSYDE